MFEGIRSPTVHTPKTISEVVLTSTRLPKAQFWAGGTYIMSRYNYYPTRNSNDIISLADIPDLKKINRTDRYIEIGSMVTYEQLLAVGKQVLPSLLYQTLEESGTSIVRKQMTIGGAISIPDMRVSLTGTLVALGAEVEVKRCAGPKTETRWIELLRLYDRKGKILKKTHDVITRIRIGFEKEDFSLFLIAGNPMFNPQETVMCSFACSYGQSIIQKFTLCITYPKSLFLASHELEMTMVGTSLPLSMGQIDKIVKTSNEELTSLYPEATHLQNERSRRFIEASLYALNTHSITEQ